MVQSRLTTKWLSWAGSRLRLDKVYALHSVLEAWTSQLLCIGTSLLAVTLILLSSTAPAFPLLPLACISITSSSCLPTSTAAPAALCVPDAPFFYTLFPFSFGFLAYALNNQPEKLSAIDRPNPFPLASPWKSLWTSLYLLLLCRPKRKVLLGNKPNYESKENPHTASSVQS